jgi:hypothetical protein
VPASNVVITLAVAPQILPTVRAVSSSTPSFFSPPSVHSFTTVYTGSPPERIPPDTMSIPSLISTTSLAVELALPAYARLEASMEQTDWHLQYGISSFEKDLPCLTQLQCAALVDVLAYQLTKFG